MNVRTAALLLALAATPSALFAQEATTPIPAAVQLDVYAAALAFYDPPRNQVRWIETTPLESGAGAPLDPALQRALVARLGDRFHVWTEDAPGQGGRLRLSPIEPAGPGRWRLAVGYRHRTPYYEGSASTQRFLVGCEDGGCRILERGPGDGAERR